MMWTPDRPAPGSLILSRYMPDLLRPRDRATALRVGTFNARFLPHLPGNARRAHVLAGRILDGGYDLILLTEVFSERARRTLLARLAGACPWNVQSIASRRMLREDSGLMLLSRLPFETLPAPREGHHPGVRASASGTAADWPHVWFVEYQDCCYTDCLAGKGAGYVRVLCDGTPVRVFFTHMQARYDHHPPRKQERTRDIRRTQLEQLAGLVREALGADHDSRQPAILLGDFNVDGARSADRRTLPIGDGGDEWSGMLDLLNGAFPGGIVDAWDRYAPHGDPGYTFSARKPHARRDYVFLSVSDPSLPLSVQQVSLAHNLAGSDGGADGHLSDHLGINVDLNLAQAGCHPRDAHALGELGNRMVVECAIRHPGGLQWYRLGARGTFEIDAAAHGETGAPALEVYAADDISRPLHWIAANGPRNGSARRYALAGEVYLRVGSPTSGWSGECSLSVTPSP